MRSLHISKQITFRNDQSLDKYLNDINKISLITAEQEVQLAIRIREGDPLALEALIRANLRFVVSVAKQYQNQGLSLSDLINEGNIGLVKAASKFDETRGFKFISYAVWWIRQAVIQALAENSRIVRLPLNKIGVINKIKNAAAHFEQVHNRFPSIEELSKLIDSSVEEIELCFKNSGKDISFDSPINEEGKLTLLDTIKSNHYPAPETSLLLDSLQDDLESVFKTLSPRESEILKLYYGIGCDAMTLEEIGRYLDIGRERVRQIRECAIKNIKKSGRSNILIKYL